MRRLSPHPPLVVLAAGALVTSVLASTLQPASSAEAGQITGAAGGQIRIRYAEVPPQRRAQVSTQPCRVPSGVRLLPRSTFESPLGNWSAIVYETDPVVVPYDQAQACVQLRGPAGKTYGVSLRDFRTLRVQWVNDRVVTFFTDVGHTAGVYQVLDLESLTWIYAQAEYYSY